MSSDIWKRFVVELKFRDRLCGSVPLNPNLVEQWVKARLAKRTHPGVEADLLIESVTNSAKGAVAVKEEIEQKVSLGFLSDEKGLYIPGYTLRAHLKDCAAQVQGYIGVKRHEFANAVYVDAQKLHLGKTEADGVFDRNVHAMTPMGPINALKSVFFVERATVRAPVLVLGKSKVSLDTFSTVLEYGSIHGLGGERSMGDGRYDWTVTDEKGVYRSNLR